MRDPLHLQLEGGGPCRRAQAEQAGFVLKILGTGDDPTIIEHEHPKYDPES